MDDPCAGVPRYAPTGVLIEMRTESDHFLGLVNFRPEICLNSSFVMAETDLTYFLASRATSTKPVVLVYMRSLRVANAAKYGF